jgi:hypothetical protein
MDARIESGTASSAPTYGFPRSVLVAGVAIVALVVIAIIAAVALQSRPTEYAVGSPQAAFQDYYRAWERHDIDAAYGDLSSAVTKELSLTEYRNADSEQSWQRTQDRRLVLLGADVTGDRAVLNIRVDEFSGGGIGGQRYSSERSVRLVREGGNWMIDEPLAGIESVGYLY